MSRIRQNVASLIAILGRTATAFLLACLLAGWLTLAGNALYCSLLPLCRADAADWWSLFLAAIGFPVVAFQLYRLQKSVKEASWIPEIAVGIFSVSPSPATLASLRKLPTEAELSLQVIREYVDRVNESPWVLQADYESVKDRLFPTRLIIKNTGRRALRYMKVEIRLVEFPGETVPAFGISAFKPSPNRMTWILTGGSEKVIYPHDYVEHQLILGRSSTETYLHNLKNLVGLSSEEAPSLLPYRAGNYIFTCKIWGDGIREPVEQTLTLSVTGTDSQLDVYNTDLVSRTGTKHGGSSKYGFETDEDRERKLLQAEEEANRREEARKAREELAQVLADKLDPQIRDILEDFARSYGKTRFSVRRDGRRIWSIREDGTYSDPFFVSFEIEVDENEVYLHMRDHRDRIWRGRRDKVDVATDAIPNLRKVLEDTIEFPIRTHSSISGSGRA